MHVTISYKTVIELHYTLVPRDCIPCSFHGPRPAEGYIIMWVT